MSSFLPIENHSFRQDGIEDRGVPHMLLVDMNSFFASVEQQANPFYRNKPLGVCASMHNTGCIIAASKEAKRLGVTTGTVVWKAKKICPNIILVPSEPAKYREVNRRFSRILEDYSDRIESYSIDESFLDLSDSKINPLLVGAEIKRRIRQEIGDVLTCSVGISENKFLAKLASDMNKPDGLTVIWRNQLREVYKKLRLTDLWGVARGWERRLSRLGIVSPLDMLGYPVGNLLAAFGKPGFYIWQRINGLEQDEISSHEDPPKTFGHSWVLNFRSTDKGRLGAVVMRLAEKAARRMRREGFQARGMYLSVALAEGKRYSQSRKVGYSMDSGMQLYEEALKMWANWDFSSDAVQVAVGFFGLTPRQEQLSLFGESRQTNLNDSIDLINNKYGEFTVRPGLLVHTQDFAPDAIAFGK